ncbi:MAG: SGNH/GDSL hydrolase family protein [Eubacteriales bacterium]|nr:SGNH/GDSL hydrolase family protein [Eubacteriales bacterium]
MNFKDFEKNSVIMMSGDSVTDCGRGRPYGTYLTGLGDGYVKRMHEIVTATYPEFEIKFINTGISGETSRQVRARWISDIEGSKPDYATLLIGVNDIWRKHDFWMDKEVAVHIDEYEDNLRYITEYSVKNLKSFTLIAPFYLELNKKDMFMQDVIAYSAVCKKLASEYGCGFIDLQPELDRLCKTLYTKVFSPDRVHPTQVTHYAIARYILKQWKFKF